MSAAKCNLKGQCCEVHPVAQFSLSPEKSHTKKIQSISAVSFTFQALLNFEKTVRYPDQIFTNFDLFFNSRGQSSGVLVFFTFSSLAALIGHFSPLWDATVTIDIVREHRIVFGFCVDIR